VILLKVAVTAFQFGGAPEGAPKAIIGIAITIVTIKSEIRIVSLLFSVDVFMFILVIFVF
jgi:hypothetical protein